MGIIVQLFENPLNEMFGNFTRILFDFFGNYGLAIIALTVIIRGLLIPFNISSQRSMLKNQALSAKITEVQKKYPNDKQKREEEIMRLQQENGAMSISGCIIPVIQIFLIWPIFRVVSAPLRHISQVSVANIEKMMDLAGLDSSKAAVDNIQLIQRLGQDSNLLQKCIDKGYIAMGQLMDLNFLGIDLTMTPSITKWTSDPAYLPLLMIPILVVATSVLSIMLANRMKPDYKAKKEAKANQKVNPSAISVQADSTERTALIMNWVFPVIMLISCFTMPAAMGLYWIIGGIMGIITQVVVFFLLTRPYENKKKELEAQKELAIEALKTAKLVVSNGKKKK